MALVYTPWLFVIIGTTGSGKTKLSVELSESLARKYPLKPEIISSDSMQIYKQIDVLSAKATVEEQARVKHHLLDIVDVDDETFNVGVYQKLARSLVEELLKPPSVPILVGGTNFYVEAVIWDDKYNFDISKDVKLSAERQEELDNLDPEALHALLAKHDPVRAEKLHPNMRRKVMRSLEIFYATNKTHTAWMEEQREKNGKCTFAFPNTCVFWVSCDKEILDERLNKRVDDMVDSGLKDELKAVSKFFSKKPMNWERGALQSIGLREFRDWIEHYQQDETFDDQKIFGEAVELVKTHTRQYSRSQTSWIKNSLSPATLIFKMDSSDPSQWYEKVLLPATEIASKFLENSSCEAVKEYVVDKFQGIVEVIGPHKTDGETPVTAPIWKKYPCEFCDRILNGENEWIAHQKAKAHKAARSRHFKPNPSYPTSVEDSKTKEKSE